MCNRTRKRDILQVLQYNHIYCECLIEMIKIKKRKERKKDISKTQADQSVQSQLRVSLAEPVKQRLRQISCINNNQTQSHSRDWTLDEYRHPIQLETFNQRRYETISFKGFTPNVFGNKAKIDAKVKDDQIPKLNKTIDSSRWEDEAITNNPCTPINLQFQKLMNQGKRRIHSNAEFDIQLDNNTFKISQKILREAALKGQTQFNQFLNSKNSSKFKETNDAVVPIYRKVGMVNPYRINTKSQIELNKVKLKQKVIFNKNLTCKRQFLDLTTILAEQRKNNFCPMKLSLSVKSRGKRIS